MNADLQLDSGQRKLLNDIGLKIVDVQAADLRQTEATASTVSALAVAAAAATAAAATSFKAHGQLGEAWVFAVLLLIEGVFALFVGHALDLRTRASIKRAEGARERLAERVPNGAALVAELGDWRIPPTVARRMRSHPWMIPGLLRTIGGLVTLGGVILIWAYLPSFDSRPLRF